MAVRRKKSQKSNIKLTRKQIRKEKRKEKKIKRNEYYTNRKKPGNFVLSPNKNCNTSNTNEQKPGHFKQNIKNVNNNTTNKVNIKHFLTLKLKQLISFRP